MRFASSVCREPLAGRIGLARLRRVGGAEVLDRNVDGGERRVERRDEAGAVLGEPLEAGYAVAAVCILLRRRDHPAVDIGQVARDRRKRRLVDLQRVRSEDPVPVLSVADDPIRVAGQILVQRLTSDAVADDAKELRAQRAPRGHAAGRVEVVAAGGRCQKTEKNWGEESPYAPETSRVLPCKFLQLQVRYILASAG